MEDSKIDIYVESKISETELKKNNNEIKRKRVCNKNNLLEKYLSKKKHKNELFTLSPWEDLYQKENLIKFLTSSKHVETVDLKYGMNKLFIYNFLVNHELNDIPKEISEYFINLYFKDINNNNYNIEDKDDLSISSSISTQNNDEELDDEEIEIEFLKETENNSIDDVVDNDFEECLNNEIESSKIDVLESNINEEQIIHKSNVSTFSNISNKSEKKNTLTDLQSTAIKKSFLESKMDSQMLYSKINKLKPTYNNENINDTIDKISNKKKLLENFFSQNTYIDKKLEILRFMKANNIECFNTYDFDVLDNNGNKIITQENIDDWYAAFKNIESRKNNIFNPSLLIISSVLFGIEHLAKIFNIKEFQGISKNFSDNNVPQDLLSTKEYLDEHISNNIPRNPIFDFSFYLAKVFFEKKLSL